MNVEQDSPIASRIVAAQMRDAAAAWLDTLTLPQRKPACWAAPGTDAASDAERGRWFYTPTDHGGLTMGEQRPAQQRKVMQLLKSGLSTAGYVTVSTIIGWENVLDLVEDFSVDWERERGRDPGMYYLRVFGDPLADRVWGWRFGGHHVSLNFLVADGHVAATTPCFVGADPATAPALGGIPIRPLSQVEDLARELARSLSPDLLREALLWPQAPSDIVGGNRTRISPDDRMLTLPHIWRGQFSDPAVIDRLDTMTRTVEEKAGVTEEGHARLALSAVPKGLPGSAMVADQRALLEALVHTYTGRVADGLAPQPDLDEVHFAWAGSLAAGEPHYYRLQGPRFLAEWDNTQRNANHAHSVWRNPESDFGADVLADHLSEHHRRGG